MKPHAPSSQRGSASLTLVLILVGIIILGAGYANRALLFEQKTAANQYRATQAFEAAEAGLEWTIAQLNNNTPLDSSCRASTDPDDLPFSARYLQAATSSGALIPRTPPPNGAGISLQPACVQTDAGWSCSCPAAGLPTINASKPDAAFAIRLEAGEQGLLDITSSACVGSNPSCVPGQSGAADASARVHATVGRTAGLSAQPAAALLVRGPVSASTATFQVRNEDADSGVTVHSGGDIQAPLLELASAPGAPGAASTLARDEALSKLSAEGFFASIFRMSKAAWKHQPTVREVMCEQACDVALRGAIGSAQRQPMIWLEHGLRLDTAVVLGSADKPVLLVVNGPVQIRAQAVIHGAVYAMQPSWDDSAGATIQGAVMLENDLQATGKTQIHHNADVLQRLHRGTGTFARVPGSWRDF